MKILKLAVIPALALAAGISLPACGGGTSAHTVKPAATATRPVRATATPSPAATTPVAAASPAGTWNVAYSSAPASILGQYSITEDGSVFYMATKTALDIPVANCSLPAGTELGSFSASAVIGNYSGTENLYEPGSCANASTSAAFTATMSGSTMTILVPDQQSVTLTRAGSSTPPSAPPAATPVATPPASSPADCAVPDFIGAGLNGHIAAAAAVNEVANSCPPVGYHVVTIVTVSGPAGTPPGGLWKESPPAGTSAAPGSTVKLYFQP